MRMDKSEDVRRSWKYINALDQAVRGQNPALNRSADDIARRDQAIPQAGTEKMHPFKLYQYPACLRATAAADDWRKFRVRGGMVLGTAATGTDGVANPDGEILPSVTDITVPAATAQYWFWLEVGTTGGGSVQHGATPASAGWDTFPAPDETHVPIGYVDTLTYAADQVAAVRQLLREDIVWSGKASDEGLIEAPVIDPGYTYMTGGTTVIRAITVVGDYIYVGGNFQGVNGAFRCGLAKFDHQLRLQGEHWFLANSTGRAVDPFVSVVGAYDSDVIVWGWAFEKANGWQVGLGNGVFVAGGDGRVGGGSEFPATGTVDMPYTLGMARVPGSNYWILNTYNWNGTNNVPGGLVKVNGVGGTIDTSFDCEDGLHGTGGVMCSAPSGVYIEGVFDYYNNVMLMEPDSTKRITSGRIIRLTSTGATVDSTFECTGNGLIGSPRLLLPMSSGILALGALTKWGGYNEPGVGHVGYIPLSGGALFSTSGGDPTIWGAHFNVDGTLDYTNLPYPQFIQCAAVDGGGKVLIGTICSSDFTIPARLFRLNSDGSEDTSWTEPTFTHDRGQSGVEAIAVLPNGNIVFGGGFLTVNGQDRTHLAMLDSSGTLL